MLAEEWQAEEEQRPAVTHPRFRKMGFTAASQGATLTSCASCRARASAARGDSFSSGSEM